MVYMPQKNNIIDVILQLIDNLLPQANNKNINIKMPDTSEEINVMCDINMINTIIRNLISNAIKFSHSSTTIEINIDDFEEDNNYIKLSIKDSGLGMPPEIVAKLFKVGEKVTTRGTAKETGTGLGLILCKEFIDKHNCKI
jgi:signal transduction histidine kinase